MKICENPVNLISFIPKVGMLILPSSPRLLELSTVPYLSMNEARREPIWRRKFEGNKKERDI